MIFLSHNCKTGGVSKPNRMPAMLMQPKRRCTRRGAQPRSARQGTPRMNAKALGSKRPTSGILRPSGERGRFDRFARAHAPGA